MLLLLAGIALVFIVPLAGAVLLWRLAGQILHPHRQSACEMPAGLVSAAERVEFPSRDGVCLRGWWIPARRPRGTIVLSHGYAGDCSPDLEYGEWLRGASYNLLYFDYRGHGSSDGNYTTLGHHETRDLLGAIDFAETRSSERVGVLGFSMGGSVAIQTAALTDSIRCVVADCSFANLRTLLLHHAPDARVPGLIAPAASFLLVAFMSLQAGENLFLHSPENSIGQIAPRAVLLIQAGNDELVAPSETERLYAAARPPKELWRVQGALHRAVDQVAPEEYRRRITAFFDQHLAAGRVIDASERFSRPPREQPSPAQSHAAD